MARWCARRRGCEMRRDWANPQWSSSKVVLRSQCHANPNAIYIHAPYSPSRNPTSTGWDMTWCPSCGRQYMPKKLSPMDPNASEPQNIARAHQRSGRSPSMLTMVEILRRREDGSEGRVRKCHIAGAAVVDASQVEGRKCGTVGICAREGCCR